MASNNKTFNSSKLFADVPFCPRIAQFVVGPLWPLPPVHAVLLQLIFRDRRAPVYSKFYTLVLPRETRIFRWKISTMTIEPHYWPEWKLISTHTSPTSRNCIQLTKKKKKKKENRNDHRESTIQKKEYI